MANGPYSDGKGTNMTQQPLNHYAQQFRSGITMKQKLATDKRIEQDRKQAERDRTRDAWGNKK